MVIEKINIERPTSNDNGEKVKKAENDPNKEES